MTTDDAHPTWTPFDCDDQSFEYLVVHARGTLRPAGWPAHKPSPDRSVPQITVIVRNPGDDTGLGMIYPDGTNVTVEHARATARMFWETLTGKQR